MSEKCGQPLCSRHSDKRVMHVPSGTQRRDWGEGRNRPTWSCWTRWCPRTPWRRRSQGQPRMSPPTSHTHTHTHSHTHTHTAMTDQNQNLLLPSMFTHTRNVSWCDSNININNNQRQSTQTRIKNINIKNPIKCRRAGFQNFKVSLKWLVFLVKSYVYFSVLLKLSAA